MWSGWCKEREGGFTVAQKSKKSQGLYTTCIRHEVCWRIARDSPLGLKRCKVYWSLMHSRIDNYSWANIQLLTCIRQLVSLPGLPTVQFLITCSIKKNGRGRPGPFYHVNDFHVHLDRQRGGGIPHQKNKLEALSAPSAGVLPECSQSEKHRIAPGSEWVCGMHYFD